MVSGVCASVARWVDGFEWVNGRSPRRIGHRAGFYRNFPVIVHASHSMWMATSGSSAVARVRERVFDQVV